ncbi:MAG: hypothetical protein ACTSXT_01450 [Candidatus Helarchaeota archaeon]
MSNNFLKEWGYKHKFWVELTNHYKEFKPKFKQQLLKNYNIDCGIDYANYIFNNLKVKY